MIHPDLTNTFKKQRSFDEFCLKQTHNVVTGRVERGSPGKVMSLLGATVTSCWRCLCHEGVVYLFFLKFAWCQGAKEKEIIPMNFVNMIQFT